MALLMLLLVLQVLLVLQDLRFRSMPRFAKVLKGVAGQHDGERECWSFARKGELVSGVQGQEGGVSLEGIVVVVVAVVASVVRSGTAAGIG